MNEVTDRRAEALFQATWLLRICGLLVISLALTANCADVRLTADAANPGAQINRGMWGLFFEDINFGADGGLHAELVKNGAFEFTQSTAGWRAGSGRARLTASGNISAGAIRTNGAAYSVSPSYLVLRAGDEEGPSAVVNEGFRGIAVQANESYEFSAYARSAGGATTLRVEVTSAGKILASTIIKGFGTNWQKHSGTITASGTDQHTVLRLTAEGTGDLHLDHVSLMPTRRWTGQANMLRADLVQMLADLKPGFLRFPGGCIVEGRTLPLRYQWKNTIGPVEQRPLMVNRWNDEFKHRPAPDYFQSFKLGFFEYFLLAEDIGAEPLPIINCGIACQFNTGQLAPMDQLEPYLQDALDLIEFANGEASTKWGAKRAAMGHPKPFNLKVLGIGNEQWGPQYVERYAVFAKVLKARHPGIQLVSSAGPAPEDDKFRFLWPKLRELKADIVDEHCYANPRWFFENVGRYDGYDRKGPKVFMGEFAAQSVKTVSPENRNTLECALAEAAYMTGLERNGDVVVMSSYAPLFAHVDAWQWTPNLIWFDNLRVVGTPSYYVQQLFSLNPGDRSLPLTLDAPSPRPRLFASAVRDEKAGELILKVVNAGETPIPASILLKGAQPARVMDVTVLTGPAFTTENTLDDPRAAIPEKQKLEIFGPAISHSFIPRSLSVLRIKAATTAQ